MKAQEPLKVKNHWKRWFFGYKIKKLHIIRILWGYNSLALEFKIVVIGKYPFASLFHKVNSRDEAVCVELSPYKWNMMGMWMIRSCLCGRGDPLERMNGVVLNICLENSARIAIGLRHFVCGKEGYRGKTVIPHKGLINAFELKVRKSGLRSMNSVMPAIHHFELESQQTFKARSFIYNQSLRLEKNHGQLGADETRY